MLRMFFVPFTLFLLVPLVPADPGPYDDHQNIIGPSNLSVNGLLAPQYKPCQPLDQALPLSCDANGNLPEHRATFDLSSVNELAVDVMELRIYVEWAGGTELGGFSVTVCSDRDDDEFCGMGYFFRSTYYSLIRNAPLEPEHIPYILPNPEEAGYRYKWEDDVTTNQQGNKLTLEGCDGRDCGNALEMYVCIRRDTGPGDSWYPTHGDGDWDDVMVGIDAWANEDMVSSEGSEDSTGAGANLGSFDVYLERGLTYSDSDPTRALNECLEHIH